MPQSDQRLRRLAAHVFARWCRWIRLSWKLFSAMGRSLLGSCWVGVSLADSKKANASNSDQSTKKKKKSKQFNNRTKDSPDYGHQEVREDDKLLLRVPANRPNPYAATFEVTGALWNLRLIPLKICWRTLIESPPTITTRWGNGLLLRTFFISLRRLRVRWKVYQLAIQFLFVLLPAVFGGWSPDIGSHLGFQSLRQFAIHLGLQTHVIFLNKNNVFFGPSKSSSISPTYTHRTRF